MPSMRALAVCLAPALAQGTEAVGDSLVLVQQTIEHRPRSFLKHKQSGDDAPGKQPFGMDLPGLDEIMKIAMQGPGGPLADMLGGGGGGAKRHRPAPSDDGDMDNLFKGMESMLGGPPGLDNSWMMASLGKMVPKMMQEFLGINVERGEKVTPEQQKRESTVRTEIRDLLRFMVTESANNPMIEMGSNEMNEYMAEVENFMIPAALEIRKSLLKVKERDLFDNIVAIDFTKGTMQDELKKIILTVNATDGFEDLAHAMASLSPVIKMNSYMSDLESLSGVAGSITRLAEVLRDVGTDVLGGTDQNLLDAALILEEGNRTNTYHHAKRIVANVKNDTAPYSVVIADLAFALQGQLSSAIAAMEALANEDDEKPVHTAAFPEEAKVSGDLGLDHMADLIDDTADIMKPGSPDQTMVGLASYLNEVESLSEADNLNRNTLIPRTAEMLSKYKIVPPEAQEKFYNMFADFRKYFCNLKGLQGEMFGCKGAVRARPDAPAQSDAVAQPDGKLVQLEGVKA